MELEEKLLTFQIFQSSRIKNRILYDIKELLNREEMTNLNIENLNDQIHLSINEKIMNKKVTYKFIITKDYPFKPPIVYYNAKSFIELTKISNLKSFDIMKKIHPHYCLCCCLITCQTNWLPIYNMSNVINEIKKYRQYRQDIVIKILLDKIKFKYLIEDIDLDSWFFMV